MRIRKGKGSGEKESEDVIVLPVSPGLSRTETGSQKFIAGFPSGKPELRQLILELGLAGGLVGVLENIPNQTAAPTGAHGAGRKEGLGQK